MSRARPRQLQNGMGAPRPSSTTMRAATTPSPAASVSSSDSLKKRVVALLNEVKHTINRNHTPSSMNAQPSSPNRSPELQLRDLEDSGVSQELIGVGEEYSSPIANRIKGKSVDDYAAPNEYDMPLFREAKSMPIRYRVGVNNAVPEYDDIPSAGRLMRYERINENDHDERRALVRALKLSNHNAKNCQIELRECVESFESYRERMNIEWKTHRRDASQNEAKHMERIQALEQDVRQVKHQLEVEQTFQASLTSSPSHTHFTPESSSSATSACLHALYDAEARQGPVEAHAFLRGIIQDTTLNTALSGGKLPFLLNDVVAVSLDGIVSWHRLARRIARRHDTPQRTRELQQTSKHARDVRRHWLTIKNDVANEVEDMRALVEAVSRRILLKAQASRRERDKHSVHLQNMLKEEHTALKSVQTAYRKETNWRRLLHNELAQRKGSVRVVCRVRPLSQHERKLNKISVLSTDCQSPTVLALVNPHSGTRTLHEFDYVFGQHDKQEDLHCPFDDLITSLLDGYNISLFAYGAMGSGKTHTLFGSHTQPGSAFQVLQHLFELTLSRRATHYYDISMSVVELHNDVMKDLLDEQHSEVCVERDENGNFEVNDTRYISIASYRQAQRLLWHAVKQRSFYASSSKHDEDDDDDERNVTHCVTHVRVQSSNSSTCLRYKSRLCLVDLAASTLFNSDFVRHNTHVSMMGVSGDSKLAALLGDSIGSDAKSMFYVCVNPCAENLPETLDILRFAGRMRRIQHSPQRHIDTTQVLTDHHSPATTHTPSS